MKSRAIRLVVVLSALMLGLAGRPDPVEAVPFYAEDVVDPNLLLIVDTSGSMTFDTYGCAGRTYVYAGNTYTLVLAGTYCNTAVSTVGDAGGAATWGDGTAGIGVVGETYWGRDQGTPNPPSVTLDGLTNDSRLFIAKAALNTLIPNTEGVRFALARYFQTEGAAINPNADWYRIGNYANNAVNRVTLNYDWPADGCAQSASAADAGKLLVNFPLPSDASNANVASIQMWMNGTENFGAGDYEIRARGATPIGGILTWANSFFTATEAADTAACRKNYALLITDGNETCGGDPVAAATTLHNNGYDVFVIGFAIAQGQASINAIAVAGGTDANADNDDNPATGNAAFFAGNPTELQQALTDVINAIKKGNFARSAPVVSFGLDSLYVGYFDMPGWKGHFERYALSDLNTPAWDAGPLLESKAASSRTMYTVQGGSRVELTTANAGSLSALLNPAPAVALSCASDPSATTAEIIVNFIRDPEYCNGAFRGARATDNDYTNGLSWKLQDIYHAEPAIVGKPSLPNNEASYIAFRTAQASRPTRLLAGTNGGTLHAFDENGNEIWSWIPNNLLGKLRDLRQTHQFFADSTPTVADVQFDDLSWHTVVIAGERQGGAYYYALDISSVDNPQPLWEFTHARLGQTWSQPAVTNVTGYGWVAFVGGGRPYSGSGCNPTDAGCATTLLAIKIEDGSLVNGSVPQLNEFNVGDLAGGAENGLVALPYVYEKSFGYGDTVLMGDLEGRLWKFDVSTGNANTWEKCLLYDPDDSDNSDNGTVNRRPVYKTVSVYNCEGKPYVAFATGDETQPASTEKEWVYIVPLGDTGACPTPSGGQEAFWFTGKNGAGEQLAAAEKVLGRPLVVGGHMYFTTYTSTDACQLGTGKLYDLTLSCADPSQITKDVTDLGIGVPSKVVLGPGGIYWVESGEPPGGPGGGSGIEIKKKDIPGFPSSYMKSWRQVY
ncbi:MAG: hypothetical protein A2V83_08755 [Nitrospirae bacterium RBG_16_64_22]|nr:MAG: hypothetical protein A2V83_08755 [Nitrospirae bacterium RBG_16_64_22]